MPKYRVTSPDGHTYEVTAPDGASQADIMKFAQAQAHPAASKLPPAPPSVGKRSALQTAGDFVGNVVDNLTPNWGDEIAGAGAWLGAKAGVNGRDPKTAFGDAQREFKAAQASYKANHSTLAKASAAYGLIGGLAAPVGRVAEGASLGARALHSYAVGTGMGAIAGAGEGDTLRDRAVNAATTGAVGGLIGAAAEPLLSGAGWAGRVLRNTVPGADAAARAIGNVPRRIMNQVTTAGHALASTPVGKIGSAVYDAIPGADWAASKVAALHRPFTDGPIATRDSDAQLRAGKLIQDHLRGDHIQTGFGQTGAEATPDAVMAEMQRRQAMGIPAMAGDTTGSLRGLTGWASRGMGPGQTMVRRALDERKTQEALRVRQHIQDTLGGTADPALERETIMADAKAKAAPAYKEAYAQPMVVTPEIQGIMQTPAFRKAVPQAHENILNDQRDPHELGFRMDADGNVTAHHGLSFEGFDQVVRAMKDDARAAMDTSGPVPRDTTSSVHINGLARDLRQALGDQNPAYREAHGNYGDALAQRDALDAGSDFIGKTGSEIAAEGRRTPDGAKAAWSLGARSALADTASEYGAKYETANVARRVRQALGDDQKQDAIGQMMGNTGGVRDLQDRLEAEHQQGLLWNEVYGNSKTAQRQQADQDVNQSLAAGFDPGALHPFGLATRVMSRAAAGVWKGQAQDTKAQVARILTETDPDTFGQAFARFNAANQRQDARNALKHQLAVQGTRVFADNVQPNDPGDSDTGR